MRNRLKRRYESESCQIRGKIATRSHQAHTETVMTTDRYSSFEWSSEKDIRTNRGILLDVTAERTRYTYSSTAATCGFLYRDISGNRMLDTNGYRERNLLI